MGPGSTRYDLTTLRSFVPAWLVRRLAANPAPLMEPEIEKLQAAVLFADISGFSVLAAQLAKRGPIGAEELTAILNSSFEQILTLIHDHGGDVVKFAGDAVLALWKAEDNDPASASRQAAQCALAVNTALNNYDFGSGIQLSVHSGLGAGEVSIACIGGQLQRWEVRGKE